VSEPVEIVNRENLVERHPHGLRFLDDEGRCLACAVGVLTAEVERVRAALRLMSRHAEEQELLMPLHEQRQVTEALA